MRSWVFSAIVSITLAVLPTLASAGDFHQRLMRAGSHSDSRDREFQVYSPEDVATDGSAPLITVLHGCRQTEENMIVETRFTELADQHGFVVVFPFVTSYDEFRFENCWGFWFPVHRTEGSGEVHDLRRIIAAVETEFRTDPPRRYVTGLSSGAAMAVAVAVAYSEDIAAVGSVAGLPYGEDSTAVGFACGLPVTTNTISEITGAMAAEQRMAAERRLVPLIAIQSLNDCTVPILNGRNLRDSWVQYYGANNQPAMERDCMRDGVSCAHRRFADAEGRAVVETVFYSGEVGEKTHYWPGDNPGQFANPKGPSATDLLWAFFREKRLDETRPAEVVITSVTVEDTSVVIAGTARAETGVEAVRVRLEGDAPVVTRTASLTNGFQWSVVFEDVPSDRFYLPVITVTLGDRREVTVTGERIAVGNPVKVQTATGTWQQHLAEGRIGQPAPECPNPLFGVCDRDFTSLFFEHQFAPFPLFAREDGNNWYADRDNLPSGG